MIGGIIPRSGEGFRLRGVQVSIFRKKEIYHRDI